MRVVLLLAALAACRSPAASGAVGDATPAPRVVTVVSASGGTFPVRVEVADDDPSRERGLMYRRSLGDDDGMLFVFPESQKLTFWMKNTLIPLDMLFIRDDRTIAGIVENATPQTTDPRGVETPTQYVLEVNGGWCAGKGVKAGDRVVLPELAPAK